MITDKEILERLQNGENIADIMKEIEATVNTALSEKQRIDEEAKRQAEADHARQEAEKIQASNNKKIAVRGLLDAIAEACDVWGYTDIAVECDNMSEADIAEIVEIIDQYGEMFKLYAKIGNFTFPFGGSKPTLAVKKQPVAEEKSLTPDEIIAKFLKSL